MQNIAPESTFALSPLAVVRIVENVGAAEMQQRKKNRERLLKLCAKVEDARREHAQGSDANLACWRERQRLQDMDANASADMYYAEERRLRAAFDARIDKLAASGGDKPKP